MKASTLTLPLSIGVLAGAYAIAFGPPPQISQLWQDAPAATEAAPDPAPGRGARGAARATTVVLAPLEAQPYTLTLNTLGSAMSLRRSDIVATEAGAVVETALQANRRVAAGDVLLRLDDRTERLDLEIAQAQRDQAQATLTRSQELHRNGSAVVTDVALAEAEVALRLAEADVGLAELALERRTVTAPIAGRLGLSDVKAGDQLAVGDAIVTIDDATTLLASFEVPERAIALLAEGKQVSVTTPTYAGRIFEARITAFDSRLDSVTRSATVEAEIENADGLLLSGMTFTIRMSDDTAPLPVVPSTAITWDRSGAGIWLAEDGRATRLPVTIRYREGDRIWIETDAPLGAQVVTEGAAKLREGAAVASATGAGPAS